MSGAPGSSRWRRGRLDTPPPNPSVKLSPRSISMDDMTTIGSQSSPEDGDATEKQMQHDLTAHSKSLEDVSQFMESCASVSAKAAKAHEEPSRMLQTMATHMAEFADLCTPNHEQDQVVLKPWLTAMASMMQSVCKMSDELHQSYRDSIVSPFGKFSHHEVKTARDVVTACRRAKSKHQVILAHPASTPEIVGASSDACERLTERAVARLDAYNRRSHALLLTQFADVVDSFMTYFKSGLAEMVKIVPQAQLARAHAQAIMSEVSDDLERAGGKGVSPRPSMKPKESRKLGPAIAGLTADARRGAALSMPLPGASPQAPAGSMSPSLGMRRSKHGMGRNVADAGAEDDVVMMGDEDSSSDEDDDEDGPQSSAGGSGGQKEAYLTSVCTQEDQKVWKFEVMQKTKMRGLGRRVLSVSLKDSMLASYEVKSQLTQRRSLYQLAKVTRSAKSSKKVKLWWNSPDGQGCVVERYIFLSLTQREEFVEATWAARSSQHAPSAQPIKVLVGTWNLGDAAPPDDLSPWLTPEAADVYAVALQECKYDPAQGGSCHVDFIALAQNALGNAYYKVAHVSLLNMLLIVFARTKFRHRITQVSRNSVATGIGNVIGNKGGCGVGFRFNETSMCFIGSHLAARIDAKRLAERNKNYSQIVEGMGLKAKPPHDVQTAYDHVFWAGDLNYRVTAPRADVLQLIKEEAWDRILEHDQLTHEKGAQRCFAGFVEAPITFMPTYRFERNSMEWSSHAKGGGGEGLRCPSYCDRVLRCSGPDQDARCLAYEPVHDIRTSDHHPLRAIYEVRAVCPNAPHMRKPCRIHVAQLAGSGWPPADGQSPQAPLGDATLVWSADYALAQPVTVGKSTSKSAEGWAWDDAAVPPMYPVGTNDAWLRAQYLRVALRDRATGDVAQGRLSLMTLSTTEATPWSIPLYSKGLPAGTLSGTMQLFRDDAFKLSTTLPKSVVKQGFLLKQGGARKNWKRRWFVLRDNGELAYYNSQKDKKPLKAFLVDGINVSHCTTASKQNCIAIDTNKRRFLFCADDEDDMFRWLSVLQRMGVPE